MPVEPGSVMLRAAAVYQTMTVSVVLVGNDLSSYRSQHPSAKKSTACSPYVDGYWKNVQLHPPHLPESLVPRSQQVAASMPPYHLDYGPHFVVPRIL